MSSGDFNVENFQSLIENYEAALKDVTEELDSVQNEQKTLKRVLNDNDLLSSELNKILSGKTQIDHEYKESDLVENLKLQLKTVTEEKDLAIKLWQNAGDAVEQLESELKIYHDNTQGLVPKAKLIELRNSYEEKLNGLQATVAQTKKRLEETINQKSRELQIKNFEVTGTLESQSNTFKIVKNLEDEVLNLQQRLVGANEDKRLLEREVKNKSEVAEIFKLKVGESRVKVEEALQVVEAALNEKDAALMREAEAREETAKLAQTLEEFIDETDAKIKIIKHDHEANLERLRQAVQQTQELVKVKESEVENYMKKCATLEIETEKLRTGRIFTDDSATSKMLVLEKNLENTFQKLLLSEKQNIQLKSEMDSIKNDLAQMSHYYERDINAREAEKTVLKNEIQKLKAELNSSNLRVSESKNAMNGLNEKISNMEINFEERIKETKSSSCIKNEEMEAAHNKIIQELQEQLISQTEINKRWRAETKSITDELEKIIRELKSANSKIKLENKNLNERLKEANLRMFEYRKFLQMISQDVTKITNITLPDLDEHDR